jgi:hypothetical protein
MKNLRGGISDLVNSLNKLLLNSTDPDEQEELQKIIGVLFALWEEVIRQELDSSTAAYKRALASLETAEAQAQVALDDLRKVQKAISAATKAAKAVDKVVTLMGPLLA